MRKAVLALALCLLAACDSNLLKRIHDPEDTPVAQEVVSEEAEASDDSASALPPIPAVSVTSSSSAAYAPLLSQAEVDRNAAQFVAALASRSPDRLRPFYPLDYDPAKLAPKASDPTFARTTLYSIVNGQTMAAKEISNNGDDLVGILFYRTSVKLFMDDPAYLQSMYDVTLFVCNFYVYKGQWQIARPTLCYNGAEGPFENLVKTS